MGPIQFSPTQRSSTTGTLPFRPRDLEVVVPKTSASRRWRRARSQSSTGPAPCFPEVWRCGAGQRGGAASARPRPRIGSTGPATKPGARAPLPLARVHPTASRVFASSEPGAKTEPEPRRDSRLSATRASGLHRKSPPWPTCVESPPCCTEYRELLARADTSAHLGSTGGRCQCLSFLYSLRGCSGDARILLLHGERFGGCNAHVRGFLRCYWDMRSYCRQLHRQLHREKSLSTHRSLFLIAQGTASQRSLLSFGLVPGHHRGALGARHRAAQPHST